MGSTIPAVVASQRLPNESTRIVQHDPYYPRTSAYGSASADSEPSASKSRSRLSSGNFSVSGVTFEGEEREALNVIEEEESDDGSGMPLVDLTWKQLSRRYLFVPFITFLYLASLVLLITFAWPPNETEKKHGQTYPHAIMWKPLAVGIFASCTIQTMRVPVWVVVSWFGINPRVTSFLSTTLHTIIHELIRLSTLPLSVPSPTSGFHSSYYLGLGWGIAEAIWGIIQGYDQLALYEDVMRPENDDEEASAGNKSGEDEHYTDSDATSMDGEPYTDEIERADEAELERKVEVLERMRERRDLEAVIGVPFPNIPLALHMLWRLDTLLLNLGLTLILSAFYFDPVPIYRHPDPPHGPAWGPNRQPSPYLWLVWALVTTVHVGLSLVWKVLGRVGVGAVTWGGLIVALGSVFAGLGGWGGLV